MKNRSYFSWAVLSLICAGVGEVFGQANYTFSPTYGAAGEAITFFGSGFSANTTVMFGSKQASKQLSSTTQLTAYVPAGLTPYSPVLIKVNGVGSFTYFTPIGTGPYISSFSPTNGDYSTAVVIHGANFTTSPKIYFNGVQSPSVVSTIVGQITAYPPQGVTTGPIKVVAANGTYASSNYFYGHPLISAVTPSSGRAGTAVKISGVNFWGANSVTFNDQPAASYIVDSNTNITAVLPVGVTRGTIKVTTPDSTFERTNIFTIPPTVTDFSPKNGRTNTVVTISGANLDVGKVTVSFNGAAAALTKISFSQLLAVVPGTASSGPMTVATGDGSFATTNFFYMPPEINNYNPGIGLPGTVVQITGRNLVDITNVSFAGVSALFTNLNGKITATVPDGAVSGPISVAGPGGTFTNIPSFLIPPTLAGFTPDAGIAGAQVQILGSNFSGTTNVLFNGVPAAFSTNGGMLTATVPTNATTGKITIRTKGGESISGADFRVDLLKLNIARLTNNEVRISWPTSAVGFALQSLTNLAQTTWTENTNPPLISNISNTVTNSEEQPVQFYRLKK